MRTADGAAAVYQVVAGVLGLALGIAALAAQTEEKRGGFAVGAAVGAVTAAGAQAVRYWLRLRTEKVIDDALRSGFDACPDD